MLKRKRSEIRNKNLDTGIGGGSEGFLGKGIELALERVMIGRRRFRRFKRRRIVLFVLC